MISSERLRVRRRMLLAGLGLPLLHGYARAAEPRVVAVGGMVTEIVYALGVETLLVATDTTSIYPEAATRLPKIGYQRSLSTEGLLALRPDLVIAAGEAGPAAAIAQLRAARVAVHVLGNEHSLDGVCGRILRIAGLLNATERGRALQDAVRHDWDESVRMLGRFRDHPRVLFVLAHTPNNTLVAGEDTAADAMIRLAAGTNAMGGFSGYRALNAEAAIAAKPDVVLVTSQGLEASGGSAEIWRKPGIALTPAGRARRLVHLDALYLLGFGPRFPAAVRDLAVAIHQAPAQT